MLTRAVEDKTPHQKQTLVAHDGRKLSLTVSIGVGDLKDKDAETLIQQVSDKTLEAKQAGRYQVCF